VPDLAVERKPWRRKSAAQPNGHIFYIAPES
jgi:hypothetical protein